MSIITNSPTHLQLAVIVCFGQEDLTQQQIDCLDTLLVSHQEAVDRLLPYNSNPEETLAELVEQSWLDAIMPAEGGVS